MVNPEDNLDNRILEWALTGRAKAIVKGLKWKGPHFTISAIKGEGCKDLCFALMDYLDSVKRSAAPASDGARDAAG